MADAWGTGAGAGGGSSAGPIAAVVGLGCWVGLLALWWVLPR
jgi:hypothetical protein